MKTINVKSLLIGILATTTVFALISGKPDGNTDNFQFVSSPAGLGIYNNDTKTLYMYKIWAGNLKDTPEQTFKVAEGGSILNEVKK